MRFINHDGRAGLVVPGGWVDVEESSISMEIPSMLHSVFDRAVGGKWQPQFVQNARIERGVIDYA